MAAIERIPNCDRCGAPVGPDGCDYCRIGRKPAVVVKDFSRGLKKPVPQVGWKVSPVLTHLLLAALCALLVHLTIYLLNQ